MIDRRLRFIFDDTEYIPIAKYAYDHKYYLIIFRNMIISEPNLHRWLARYNTPVRYVMYGNDIFLAVPYYTFLEIIYDISGPSNSQDDDDDDYNFVTIL